MLNKGNRILLVFVAALFAGMTAAGQAAGGGCPGFKNTMSFDDGNSHFFWSVRVGDRTYTRNDASDTTTGYHIMSTCVNNPDIIGHNNITSSQYYSGDDFNILSCEHTFFDANDHRFQIITSANDGIDQFTVGPGSTGIPRIPPGYLTSIRLGDMRSTGQAINLLYNPPTGNNKGSEALFYTMDVNTENSLLFINFAVVARRYSHTAYDAGEFLIRVVLQNVDGSWPNQPINDSLWYKVSAPTFNNNEMPPGWQSGYGITGTCSYAYKPWTKVAINLSRYLYRKVRIEMYTSDCIYNFDPIYAYIAGDYQSMSINASGCVKDDTDVVDTLRAPEGLLSYQWFVTTQGFESNIYNTDYMNQVHFRQVSGDHDSNVYMPIVADFVLTEGHNAGDTVDKQTFMCVMTSALDPNKPIVSKVYTNVTNSKPRMRFSAESDCNLGVQLHDQSYVYGTSAICQDSTRWIIYSDSVGTTPLDTLWGTDVSYQFQAEGDYLVSLRDMPYNYPCGGTTSKVVHCYTEHTPQISVDNRTFCEGDFAQVWCNTDCHLTKQWQIGDNTIDNIDTVRWRPSVGTTPITLTLSHDGLCPDSVSDSVVCYSYVEASINSANSTICQGDCVTLLSEGIDNPRWTSTPHDSMLDNFQGQSSITVCPQVTTTYNVEPTQEIPCLLDISDITIMVEPFPSLEVESSATFVDITDPTISFSDRSENGSSRLWTFSDGSQSTSEHVEHTFNTEGLDSVSVNLRICNSLSCCADTTMNFPVKSTLLWFPNAFTPESNSNNTFGVVTAANIIFYEIFIYNRQGLIVYHSDDPEQNWDGLNKYGNKCPQGAYVYYYRYIVDSSPKNILSGKGTVTLIR